MADFGENEEDNILKEDMNNLNELGLMRDSNEPSGYDNLSDKVNKKYNKRGHADDGKCIKPGM